MGISGIAFDPLDNVIVADASNNRIQVFASDNTVSPSKDKDNVDGNMDSKGLITPILMTVKNLSHNCLQE